ncbi:MAG: 1-deoxy-D-xylulose-5-phosphate reductoisomerase [Treponema sp.]|jgi:1-deoxy-D-xylulose-5-phosphate reductoisomerase|nr:1-deoxy-D-xylulose-5-phosphate reductoisomerase [Treponema sp.]
MKKVLVLGCTGSIGSNTLNICRAFPQKFSVCGITCNSKKEELEKLSKEFNCKCSLTSEDGIAGIEKLIEESEPDIVVNGIAGSAGLLPSKIVLDAGIDLALANKETVVMAWPLIKSLADTRNAKIIPVDSEHSAIFSLVNQIGNENISQLVITASGGPFRTLKKEELTKVTVQDALKHPTWSMGTKITIDSASLANKGLEVIEANRLFDFPVEKVQVVVHPQSLVHSLVRTNDGMLYAQISDPDMKHPIYSALTFPKNEENYLKPFDLFDHEMTFFKPRYEDFPMLKYAFTAAQKNGSYTIAYNAANEIAVTNFISGKIKFTEISEVVLKVLEKDWTESPDSFEDVFEADKKARIIAEEILK